jgi:hypothetical protein
VPPLLASPITATTTPTRSKAPIPTQIERAFEEDITCPFRITGRRCGSDAMFFAVNSVYVSVDATSARFLPDTYDDVS